ncbi:aspartate aminotransferase [Alkalithermobacter thermoalcaliphilus JW-YL-7 = DSM 7308]|uniref:Aminotransferase n=1 Tax=Alkalithermobacter thermoalcaliphilus JW-YL-7 = DSM 7308 TaxID=1121328 RepID=A0A150FSP5_CLOPD|nr:Aspartate transaminase [[Clostridium] paradoxum JW-YL-7 = DSM 7308]SHL20522.1 aspartate aminotransferase [[Clostridium] paradoxum JW-YL-7 = DSM 7308]
MISKKLSYITPSFTIGISSKVSQLKEKGENIIDLSIGEPDFNIPDLAKKEAIEALNLHKTKYDLVSGVKDLRKEICDKLKSENNISYDIDQIVVSSGAKHAITNTLISLLDYQDEVLIPKPYWVSYPEMVKLVGAVPVFIETNKENNFKVEPDDILKCITPKSKILLICNPSNPTGAVYSRKELEDIVDVCIKNNLYIISDEIYERICYENEYVSIASISDKAKEITITINGLSKSASMPGLRLGYSASSKELAKAISIVQGHLVSHPSTISQWAGYGALKHDKKVINKMVNTYKKRRDLVISMLSNIKDIDYIYPQGAFYVFIDISKLKDKINFKQSLSIEFCEQLLDNTKVAAVPGIAFGIDDYIRISYACSENDIIEGIHRIDKFINSLT